MYIFIKKTHWAISEFLCTFKESLSHTIRLHRNIFLCLVKFASEQAGLFFHSPPVLQFWRVICARIRGNGLGRIPHYFNLSYFARKLQNGGKETEFLPLQEHCWSMQVLYFTLLETIFLFEQQSGLKLKKKNKGLEVITLNNSWAGNATPLISVSTDDITMIIY